MGPEAVGAMVRKVPKRYKGFENKHKRIPIKDIVRAARKATEEVQDPVLRRCCLTLAAEPVQTSTAGTNGQGTDTQRPPSGNSSSRSQQLQVRFHESLSPQGIVDGRDCRDGIGADPPSRKGSRGLFLGDVCGRNEPSHQAFDDWVAAKGHDQDPGILSVLRRHRALFVDQLPKGLPVPRVLDHTIPLVPGALPAKGGV